MSEDDEEKEGSNSGKRPGDARSRAIRTQYNTKTQLTQT